MTARPRISAQVFPLHNREWVGTVMAESQFESATAWWLKPLHCGKKCLCERGRPENGVRLLQSVVLLQPNLRLCAKDYTLAHPLLRTKFDGH